MRTLLIDDEPEALRGMESMLKLFCPGLEVIGQAMSVAEGTKKIAELKPDLIFLDVKMKDGSGFDLLEKLEQRDFITIFVTAHDQYAIRAIRMNAFDYLLKPVDPDELTRSVERVLESGRPDYNELLESNSRGHFKKIGIPGSKGTTYLDIDSITRLESSSNYTYVHSVNVKPILVSRTIKTFEELLPPESFVRCHQSHIVNIHFVNAFVRAENAQIILKDKTVIPVSRAKRSLVENRLLKQYPSL